MIILEKDLTGKLREIMEESDFLAIFWDGILSRDAAQIQSAFNAVSEAERDDCLTHLRSMIVDTEYLSGQRESARIALEVLTASNDKTGN